MTGRNARLGAEAEERARGLSTALKKRSSVEAMPVPNMANGVAGPNAPSRAVKDSCK